MKVWSVKDAFDRERLAFHAFALTHFPTALEIAAVFEGTGHGDFIGVLDVAAGGDAGGDAGDTDREGTKRCGEPVGGSFSFEGGAGGEDNFVDFGMLGAAEEVGGAELVRAYAVER